MKPAVVLASASGTGFARRNGQGPDGLERRETMLSKHSELFGLMLCALGCGSGAATPSDGSPGTAADTGSGGASGGSGGAAGEAGASGSGGSMAGTGGSGSGGAPGTG